MSKPSSIEVRPPAAPREIASDPILCRIKDELSAIYGPRLSGVILFGSRARRENRPSSDIDILVLIREFERSRDRNDRLFQLSDEIFEETGLELNVFARDERELTRRTIFMHNVREEGVSL
jgi:predicted nucleotidyltransferase